MSFKSIFLVIVGVNFSNQIQSQSCSSYFPMDEGTKWVIESYDKKDKFVSKSIQTVTESTSSADGVFTGEMKGEVIDDKDQVIGAIDYQIKCQDGNFFVSMNSFLDPEQMSAYKDMEVEVDGDFLELPSDLQPGMTLPDAEIKVKVKNSGIALMSLTIQIFNRQVEKFESITTPAGTFECIKIVYSTQSQMGQAIPIKVKTSGAEWLAKGTGMVKSEQYNKKLNLMSYSLLTEFKQ